MVETVYFRIRVLKITSLTSIVTSFVVLLEQARWIIANSFDLLFLFLSINYPIIDIVTGLLVLQSREETLVLLSNPFDFLLSLP